jgi:hypothetical protein
MYNTMGFDLFIRCEMMLCPETGKPYCFGTDADNNLTRIYDLSFITIPKEHRRFLTLRGSFLHVYTTNLMDSSDVCDTSVNEILEKYPTWADVQEFDSDLGDYWTESDHNAFQKALEWFVNDSFIQYRVHWSY